MPHDRDALITGIGLVSCLGEGLEAHWAALNRDGGFQPVVDGDRYAPFCNLVTVCNTLRHLERVVTDILEDTA